jgi:cell filamentation protein
MASFIAHENVDYHPLEAMFDKIVQPLPPEQDRRLLPSIAFKAGTDETLGQPNMYQALSASEYEQQKQRYSYQTKGSEQPRKKTASDIRHALRVETRRLATEHSSPDATQQKHNRGR